jgi:hypothetical protein
MKHQAKVVLALVNASFKAGLIAKYAQNLHPLMKTLITLMCNEIPGKTILI